MGPFPHDAPKATISEHNPAGTDGFSFVEFAHHEPDVLDKLFRQMGFIQLAVGERRVQPSVVGGASQLEYPTRHRDGDPVSSELAHERVHQPFGSDA